MNKNPLKKKEIFDLLKKIKRTKLKKEKISLVNSVGRFLAENLKSKINLPPFKNSAVDGYAVLKSDILERNINLTCKQRIAAGDKTPYKLKKGEAARIFTGAKVPVNSSTIVMQENVILKKEDIVINKMPSYGENCRLAGEDIKKNQIILKNRDKINTTNINLIAAIGKKKCFCKKKN